MVSGLNSEGQGTAGRDVPLEKLRGLGGGLLDLVQNGESNRHLQRTGRVQQIRRGIATASARASYRVRAMSEVVAELFSHIERKAVIAMNPVRATFDVHARLSALHAHTGSWLNENPRLTAKDYAWPLSQVEDELERYPSM
jgi:hypothetical protein